MAVTVIDAQGNERQYETDTSSFALVIDGEELQPAVCTEIEVESNEQSATTGTLCGDQSTQNTSKDPFTITVSGIVTNANYPGELNVQNLLYDIHEGSLVTMRSDFPISSAIRVSNVIVRQEEATVKIAAPVTNNNAETAFFFQIQFGEEDNQ